MFARGLISPGGEAGGASAVLIRELATAIPDPVAGSDRRRRPALCHDGTPLVLSIKLGRGRSDGLRLLIEPGALDRSVAEQVALSLAKLDRLIGLLSWRAAAADINTITRFVFPPDPQSIRGWWGGIWLGASVPASPDRDSEAELRVYLNLRHGDAASRWRRVIGLLSAFGEAASDAAFAGWIQCARPHALPVGLGVVLKAGIVAAIRVYVGVAQPDLSSLTALGEPISPTGQVALADLYRGFTDRFGALRSQGVTVGYDLVREDSGQPFRGIGRVKMDMCCQFVSPERQAGIGPWVEGLATEWSLDPAPLKGFMADVDASWGGSNVEFLSFGFAPDPAHITVYVKPRS